MKNEQSSVVFRVPDFIDADGIEYTDIEITVQMDAADVIHTTVSAT